MTQFETSAPGLILRHAETVVADDVPVAVTGFVGIAEKGPVGMPKSLRSWGEYLQVFGDYVPYGHLAETVFAFFLNGGEKCWVVLAGAGEPGAIDPRLFTGYDTTGEHYAPPELEPPVGLAALEGIDEVDLVAIPDLWRGTAESRDVFRAAQAQMLRHCALRGDRLALLDPPPELGAAGIRSWPGHLDPGLAKHGALYFPWLCGTFGDARRWVPPCGFVAGQVAAADRLAGVGKAPANRDLKGVVDLASTIDRQAQKPLNEVGVNCIRKFVDGQVRVYGARTLSSDPRFVYVNVRRTLSSVVKTLSRRLAWAVFEPDDRRLRRRIESTLTGYLGSLVAKGLIAGRRQRDAFYVRCEPPGSSAPGSAGTVIAELGLALTAPVEQIVLTVRKSPESLTIVEEDT